MKRAISSIGFVMLLLWIAPIAMAGTWTTLDRPGGSHTWAFGIDGSNIVGGSSTGSFLYDGSTWTIIDDMSNYAYDIDGSNIVVDRGDLGSYLYNVTSSTRTYLHMPGAYSTHAHGIDGSNIVGRTNIGSFLYDGSTWTILEPGEDDDLYGSSIYAYGIDGSNIVGGTGGEYGFLYDGSNWTILDMPGAVYTWARGIDGSNIVGTYEDASYYIHGFLYNGSEWITLDMPGAHNTYAYGIDGNHIVGYYDGDYGNAHGFIYTIPEPATLFLLALGAVILKNLKNKKTHLPVPKF